MELICSESNLVYVPSNTWSVDSGAFVHVSRTLQGLRSTRWPRQENRLFLTNDDSMCVEAICNYNLMDFGCVLKLRDVFFIPSFRRDLISISICVSSGISFSFSGHNMLSLNDPVIGAEKLMDKLYCFSVDVSCAASKNLSRHLLTSICGSKCPLLANNTAVL